MVTFRGAHRESRIDNGSFADLPCLLSARLTRWTHARPINDPWIDEMSHHIMPCFMRYLPVLNGIGQAAVEVYKPDMKMVSGHGSVAIASPLEETCCRSVAFSRQLNAMPEATIRDDCAPELANNLTGQKRHRENPRRRLFVSSRNST